MNGYVLDGCKGRGDIPGKDTRSWEEVYKIYPGDTKENNVAGEEDKAGQNTGDVNGTYMCGQPTKVLEQNNATV